MFVTFLLARIDVALPRRVRALQALSLLYQLPWRGRSNARKPPWESGQHRHCAAVRRLCGAGELAPLVRPHQRGAGLARQERKLKGGRAGTRVDGPSGGQVLYRYVEGG